MPLESNASLARVRWARDDLLAGSVFPVDTQPVARRWRRFEAESADIACWRVSLSAASCSMCVR